MEVRSSNSNLNRARTSKQDEFYTQMSDIESELNNYAGHFKGKTVYCNCDNPYKSNFVRFFIGKFNEWGLKKLITTSYNGIGTCNTYHGVALPNTQHRLFEDNGTERAYVMELTGVSDPSRVPSESVRELNGNGDFRSQECIGILKSADIVVTNPPFSLFYELVLMLTDMGKKFLLIGNKCCLAWTKIFPLIKENRLWTGLTIPNDFFCPDGTITSQIKGLCRWFTNLDVEKRHKPMALERTYDPGKYPKYDWIDAINVDRVSDIPKDYDGVMGVPITFFDGYCPEQFEVLDCINRYAVLDHFGMNDQIQKAHGFHTSVDGKWNFSRVLIRRIAT